MCGEEKIEAIVAQIWNPARQMRGSLMILLRFQPLGSRILSSFNPVPPCKHFSCQSEPGSIEECASSTNMYKMQQQQRQRRLAIAFVLLLRRVQVCFLHTPLQTIADLFKVMCALVVLAFSILERSGARWRMYSPDHMRARTMTIVACTSLTAAMFAGLGLLAARRESAVVGVTLAIDSVVLECSLTAAIVSTPSKRGPADEVQNADLRCSVHLHRDGRARTDV